MTLDNIITIGGKEPRQVARSVAIYFVFLYVLSKLLKSVGKIGLKRTFLGIGFYFYQSYQGASGKKKQLDEISAQIRNSLVPKEIAETERNLSLPAQGIDQNALLKTLKSWSDFDNTHWNGERKYSSGTVYHGGDQLKEFQNQVFALFSLSNPLHPGTFPFLRKMESEIISMTISLFNGKPGQQSGLVTSGGTESIILAIRAYKYFAKSTKGIQFPELVFPVTAHAAFQKACELMEIKPVIVPINPKTHTVDASTMRKYINRNTIAIVGSAPQYPQGVLDPIHQLSKLAIEFNVGLHVDCCLGSFMMPALRDLGYDVTPFDFSLPGVTSISADTHKYGFSLKGTSVVMFRDQEYRRHTYFTNTDWPGGMYCTPTIAGSRSGGVIAATWAAMMSIGKSGYLSIANEIMNATNKMIECIENDDELKKYLRILGKPCMSIISIESIDKNIDIYYVSDAMSKHGWALNNCQYPNCFHICVTYIIKNHHDKFIQDLKNSIQDVINHPNNFTKGQGATYGAVVSLPNNTFKGEILTSFMDVVLQA